MPPSPDALKINFYIFFAFTIDISDPRIAKGDIRITSSFIQATSPHAACSKRISNPDAKVKERGRGIKKQSLQYLGGTAGREEKSMISKILEF